MKTIMLLIIFMLMVAGIYFYNNPQEWRELTGSNLPVAGNKVYQMYKWKNKDGVIQYTQQPPKEGIAFEKVELDSSVNVLPLPEKIKEQFED